MKDSLVKVSGRMNHKCSNYNIYSNEMNLLIRFYILLKGAFGKVYQGILKIHGLPGNGTTQRDVAVKTLKSKL